MKACNRKSHKIGEKFGRLVIISSIPKSECCKNGRQKRLLWLCRCVCGVEKYVNGQKMRAGRVQSCGCLSKELRNGRPRKYSVSINSEPSMLSTYRTWSSMMRRCFDEKSIQYADYGGRGITVCDRWKESFDNFLSDMGKKPELGLSIERIDNNGNYEPLNCKWATMKEQQSNRRNSRIVEYEGKRLGLVELCEELGKDYNSIGMRMRSGWTLEDALNVPINHHKPK